MLIDYCTLMTDYDYIICGGGMSGLSLAYYLNQSSLKNNKVLIIEPADKNVNDRTWAFWEKGEGVFEEIVYRNWKAVNFITTGGKVNRLDIGDYEYKVIRGIDFYNHTLAALRQNPRITFVKEHVLKIEDHKNNATVFTREGNSFSADFVFDSTFKLNLTLPENHNLLQHFKGNVIRTKEPVFNPALPDMMNFSVEQKNDECRFIYVLPFDERTALVEYTLFSETLLTQETYDLELSNFIKNDLNLLEYELLEEEFGVIPMSDVVVNEFPSPHVIRIGTAGGATNPATGYTFQNCQKRLQELVRQLETTGQPQITTSWWQKRHLLYASVLLNVLQKKRFPIGEVFHGLYEKNPPERVFRFLDGTTSFVEELQIMSTTPIKHFLKATVEVISQRLQRLIS